MNKFGKSVTTVLAVVGGLSGPWGAYTAYDSSKFKQPFDEHSEVSKSYDDQIASAEKRNDKTEATRIRLLYENYEEKWRTARLVARIVEPFENLSVTQLNPEESSNLKKLIEKASDGPNQPMLSPKTLGAAYLATGNFNDASVQLSIATKTNGDSKSWALKAAAYSELALHTNDPGAKRSYEAIAAESYVAASKAAHKSIELSNFVSAIPSLKAVLDQKGIELTNR